MWESRTLPDKIYKPLKNLFFRGFLFCGIEFWAWTCCGLVSQASAWESALQSANSNQQTPISKLQSANSNQQTPISKLQSADSNQQTPISRLQSANPNQRNMGNQQKKSKKVEYYRFFG